MLALAGSKARAVLAGAARGDRSAQAFSWSSARETHVGVAAALVLGVSFSGEPACEIHVPHDSLRAAHAALRAAGAPVVAPCPCDRGHARMRA